MTSFEVLLYDPDSHNGALELLIIVVGLAFEARIAAGPGMRVVCGGDSRHLSATLAAAIAEARALFGNCPGIISFGVAGGLAPQLRPGGGKSGNGRARHR